MSTAAPARKDFLSVLDFDVTELERCLEIAGHVKADRSLGRQAPTADALEGRHVAMLFEKASLRTRSSPSTVSVAPRPGSVLSTSGGTDAPTTVNSAESPPGPAIST